MNSRNKGKVGELDLAKFLREHGIEARRGQQYSGGGDSPDVVVDLPGVHFEAKRTERLALYDAVDQARRDAAPGSVPVVAHRCNDDRRKDTCRGEWLAILSLTDLLKIIQREMNFGQQEPGA